MKISFVEPHLNIYGGIRRILEFANRLAARGHDVTIFHPDGSPCDWMACNAKVKRSADAVNEAHDVIVYNDPDPFDFDVVRAADDRTQTTRVYHLVDARPDIALRHAPKFCNVGQKLHDL